VQLTLTLRCVVFNAFIELLLSNPPEMSGVYHLSYYSKKTLQICVSFSAMKMPVCIAPSKVSFLDGAHSFLSSEVWNASSMRCFMTSSSDLLLGYQTQKFGSTEFRSTLVVSAWTSKLFYRIFNLASLSKIG
jgi:hypothetical protein